MTTHDRMHVLSGDCWCQPATITVVLRKAYGGAEYVMDVFPEATSDDRMHVLADDCWCEPTILPYRRIHEGATDD